MNTPATTTEALYALENSAILCHATPSGLLRFSGEESCPFLQGQLSSDVKALAENQAQYSSYSTPKGRMLASFLAFRMAGDYWLQVDGELAPALQKRLSMFIMRSKTRCTDVSQEYALLGLAGPQAAALLETTLGITPASPPMETQHAASCSVITLQGNRFLLIATKDQANAIQQQLLAAGYIAADSSLWTLTDIRAGIPWITPATQEAFVPQMTNLDLINGVSFNKGCYPGQEIVARTRYIGKVKRRMYRARVQTSQVTSGQSVYSAEMNGQASGQIVLAAPEKEGGWEVLVSVQSSSLEHGLHLGALEGPVLEVLALPYVIE